MGLSEKTKIEDTQREAKLLVVTDLDATLLDHAYSWEAARTAIENLRERNFPLILNSSKTLAEMSDLAEALRITAPLIAENGSVIAYPHELAQSQDSTRNLPSEGEFQVEFLGVSRQEILEHAHALRSQHNYQFEGFADWTPEQVADRTGLSLSAAARAHARIGTEPIIWNDTPERWQQFTEALGEDHVRAVRGGRFIHLMGTCDKAMGLQAAALFYTVAEPNVDWLTVALGDSPNDLGMLSAADVAVVIPNDHHDDVLQPTADRIIRPDQYGPAGWNEAILHLLQSIQPPN